MALTKVSTGVVDMSQDTGGLIIAKGTTAQQLTCTAANLGSIRENTDENKVEVCTSTGWQFLEEAGPSFIPLTVDYLVIAGGGAGGVIGGGGGAGGFRTSFGTGNINGGSTAVENSLTLAKGIQYAVSVGAKGIATVTPGNSGPGGTSGNGGNSELSGSGITTITSTGGGGGGNYPNGVGGSGGSGGGGSSRVSSIAGGSRVTNPIQGFDGSDNNPVSPYPAGGGGGADAAGNYGNLGYASGGTALASSITGVQVLYAGGGGCGYQSYYSGGVNVSGGGGGASDGVGSSNATSATANTGSGGGGGGFGTNLYYGQGGDGGSGIVILRFPISYSAPTISNISPAGGLTITNSTDGTHRVMTYTCATNTTVSATLTF